MIRKPYLRKALKCKVYTTELFPLVPCIKAPHSLEQVQPVFQAFQRVVMEYWLLLRLIDDHLCRCYLASHSGDVRCLSSSRREVKRIEFRRVTSKTVAGSLVHRSQFYEITRWWSGLRCLPVVGLRFIPRPST